MKITRYLMPLFFTAAMFGADAANDLLLTQRNSTNDDNVSRNVTAAASALLSFDGSLVPTTVAIGTTAGTVAAGDDSRITGAAQKASNLSDLASATTARTNLGVGTGDSPSFAAATASTGSFTATATGTGLSLHGGGTVTGASGAITAAASGTNQNVTLTPSGSGYTILNGNVLIGTTDATGLTGAGGLKVASTTSATSSTVGALLVGNGTAATNVAIGGGNINAGGTVTSGGLLTASATTAASASIGSIRSEGGISAAGNLMFNNGVSVASVTASRRASQGLNFDGTAGATIANVPVFGTGDLTLVFWVNSSSLADYRCMIGGNVNAPEFCLNAGGNLSVRNPGIAERGGAILGLVAGKEYFIAITRTGGVWTVRVNGLTVANTIVDDNYSVAVSTFGKSYFSDRYFIGKLLGMIFNRALTAAEVLALYETGTVAAVDLPSVKAGTAATSGSLVVGVRYRITDWITNDDFTNVGAASNADGVEFIATGTTPTTWANSSVVTSLGALCALDESQPGNGNTWYDTSGNAANVTLPATGVTWAQPAKTHAPTTAYGVGTAYSLTNTAAAIDFGTTDPVCVLTEPGTYLIMGQVNLAATGATVTAETATIKVRRTNNTAADLSVVPVLDLPAMTTLTHTLGIYTIPPFTYTTTATDDSITLFANVSAALAAGTIDATAIGTSLIAVRLY